MTGLTPDEATDPALRALTEQVRAARADGTLLDIRGGGTNIIRIVIGQAYHGENLARMHIHHHAGAANAVEIRNRVLHGIAQSQLHTNIKRKPQRIAAQHAQPFVKIFLDPGNAIAVHIHTTDDMRGSAALREEATLRILKIQARNAQIIHCLHLARREGAGDIGELAFTRQSPDQPFTLKLRQRLAELVGSLNRIINLAGIGIKRGHGQRNGQHFAIAICHRRA